MDDLSGFLIGRAIGRNIGREQERRHNDVLDAIEAHRCGKSLSEYRRSMALGGRIAANSSEAKTAPYWRKGFLKKSIIEVGLRTEHADLIWGVKSLPEIGTPVVANKPFVHCSVFNTEMDLAIPYDGIVVARNQKAVEGRESIKRLFGLWLVKVETSETKQREMAATCPFCDGNIIFGIREYGGKTVSCPHCQKDIVLPNE